MTPAERLLAAADLLDKLAGGATQGPWTPHIGDVLHVDAAAWIGAPGAVTADGVYIASTANHPDGLNDAHYIATMHPEVGNALAAWLRAEAVRVQRTEHLRAFGGASLFKVAPEASALADLLLGGGEQS